MQLKSTQPQFFSMFILTLLTMATNIPNLHMVSSKNESKKRPTYWIVWQTSNA